MPTFGPFFVGFTEDDATARGLKTITDKLEKLMALDKSTQDKIDAISAALDKAASGLAADIADLKAKVTGGATTTDINAALDGLAARAAALTALDAETTQDPPAPV